MPRKNSHCLLSRSGAELFGFVHCFFQVERIVLMILDAMVNGIPDRKRKVLKKGEGSASNSALRTACAAIDAGKRIRQGQCVARPVE